MALEPGRLSRAAIHCEVGEAELRLSAAGNWQLALRGAAEREWRLACSGDLSGGAISPLAAAQRAPTRIGKLLLDLAGRRVLVADEEVEASKKEFELLAVLASDPCRVFSNAELMRAVWDCEVLRSCRTLNSHASRIRVKLRRAGAPGLVVNHKGFGYSLCAAQPLGPS